MTEAALTHEPAGAGVGSDRTRSVLSMRAARLFELPMLLAAVLVIPTIVIEEAEVGRGWKTVALGLNWLIWLAFAMELAVLVAVTPKRMRWLVNHPLNIAIVFLTPPFLPASLQAIRVLRLLRLGRLLRVAPLARRIFSLDGLRYVSLLAVVLTVAGGAAFAAVEKQKTTWDGIWWAVATMTTAGSGQAPVTVLGRLLGIGLMLVGIGLLAVLTGAVAQRFLAAETAAVAERDTEIEATDLELLNELREVRRRLDRVETHLRRRRTYSERSVDEVKG